MAGFKLFVTKVWINVLCPIWSFIINLCYWLFRLNRIKSAQLKKERLLELSLADVMSQFKWVNDNFKDWYPWIITIVDKNLEDDCDGAAILAKWWWEKHGIKSRLVFLYSADGKVGHVICVRNSNDIFVSNKELIHVDAAKDWRQEIFDKFDNKYSVLIEK